MILPFVLSPHCATAPLADGTFGWVRDGYIGEANKQEKQPTTDKELFTGAVHSCR